MVGAEDSPAHQYSTLPFASAFGDVPYQVSLLQSIPFWQIFLAFFGQMCPFAMFWTESHVAVSVAGCSGEVVVNNHVERVRSRAVITSYADLVQGSHVQLAKTLGRKKCVHLPAEYPLNGLRWSPEAVTAVFWRVHKWVDWEELVQQSKKSCLQAVVGTPCTFSFKKTFKKLWVSRKAERTQICWMSRLESKGLEKKSTIWPFVAVQV